jgi:hypothetical protein
MELVVPNALLRDQVAAGHSTCKVRAISQSDIPLCLRELA